jgi:hypothetical protein
MADVEFLDAPPVSESVTPYDERHLPIYLQLLDAEADKADWREAVRIIFSLDPAECPDRARLVHDSHLERAKWMTRQGYRDLSGRPGKPQNGLK